MSGRVLLLKSCSVMVLNSMIQRDWHSLKFKFAAFLLWFYPLHAVWLSWMLCYSLLIYLKQKKHNLSPSIFTLISAWHLHPVTENKMPPVFLGILWLYIDIIISSQTYATGKWSHRKRTEVRFESSKFMACMQLPAQLLVDIPFSQSSTQNTEQ